MLGVAASLLTVIAGCGGDSFSEVMSAAPGTTGPVSNTDPARVAVITSQSVPNARTQAVMDQLAALGAKPVETLSVVQARSQPGSANAVKVLLVKEGKSTAPEPVASAVDLSFAGPAGPVPVTIYTPTENGPFPVALFINGGGWVIGSRQGYDSSARALTNAAGAIIVSTDYRLAPENRFTAAHDETFAAYQWVRANARQFNGDPTRAAVVGESAGGNMAASIAIRARARSVPLPLHQVPIYPVTSYAFDTPSQQSNQKRRAIKH